MPFLSRRRGNAASESDMRRQPANIDNHFPTEPRLSESTSSVTDDDHDQFNESAPNAPPSIREPSLEPARSASHVDLPSRDTNDDTFLRPVSPPVQDETSKHRRFSLLRFRNASDSQLSTRAARQQAEEPPPMPRPPEIITTAPTLEMPAPQRKPSRLRLADRFRKSSDLPRHSEDMDAAKRSNTWKPRRTTGWDEGASRDRLPLVTFEEPKGEHAVGAVSPPVNSFDGDTAATASQPSNRISESSRSDAASGSFGNSPTPTKHHAPTAASFFRLPRRKHKAPPPLFDLSHLPQKTKYSNGTENPAFSTSSLGPASRESTQKHSTSSRPPSSYSARADSVASGDAPARQIASPATALFRRGSTHSGHSSPTRAAQLQMRGRSSTLSSLGRESMEDYLQPGTTRTSSSMGRKSLGDLLGLNKIRHNNEFQMSRQGTFTPATPGSSTSKNNSFQIAREPVVLPERQEDETAVKYLARVEPSLSRRVIASALSKSTDPFFATVLRSYMRRFSFFGDPMDMSIRKLLMEAELPKETQQIDRFLQAFANRYHECNPGIFATTDQAYFIAFSLLILHTDVFNKNNKYKMQQADYVKNTSEDGIAEPILKCFYDNITYTPFIHVEDDVDHISLDRQKGKRKTIFPGGTPDPLQKKSPKEPLDPYTLILDGKLDILRPSLKDVMELEDHYHYLGTDKTLNVRELQRTFFRTGVLQIVSARSRPDAFRDDNATTNPDMAPQGVVDIKVTKVGLLWRKDTKKKKTRSPWQEWGAILTGAQLYFFRNTTWIKNLMHQYDSHVKQGYYGEPITFKPALADFKPDAFMPIKDAVAVVDSTYKRHKNAFKYSRPGAFIEEVLLADNEEEMNDWLAKLNYAASFTTSGVRMRGVLGVNYEGHIRRGMRRLDSSNAAQIVQTPSGDVSIVRGKIDPKEAESILAQRQEAMLRVIAKAAEDIAAKEKELEQQLRNARHLQILSPIQAKTREEILREAARMDVKIKWIRMEIWKIKCHRDVLVKDLDEEGVMTKLSPKKPEKEVADSSSTRTESAMNRSESGGTVHIGRRPSTAGSLSQTTSPPALGQAESPLAEEFQTPPTSASPPIHRHQRSWDSSISASEILRRARSASHATVSSGTHGTPSSTRLDAQTSPHKRHEKRGRTSLEKKQSDDADANERELLEQAGLLRSPSRHNDGSERQGSVSEAEDYQEQTASHEKSERTKMRRSLQRTLRESAGHLSHHRSKRGKDSASSGVSEDTIRDDRLSRGSGSFVVHGKKASVIDFSDGLRHMPAEERLRQRMQTPQRDEPLSPSSIEEDFYDAVGHQAAVDERRDTERRESAASGSTATARSFRELHRKYSSAQSKQPSLAGGKLSVPSDTDSDAAVSISEGRRTPLPPIETQLGEEEEEEEAGAPLPGQSRSQLQSPASPETLSSRSPTEPHQQKSQHQQGEADQDHEAQQLSSPQMQAIRA